MYNAIQFFFNSSWKQILIASIASLVVAGLNLSSLHFFKELVTAEQDEKLFYFGLIATLVISSLIISFIVGKKITWHFEKILIECRESICRNILGTPYDAIKDRLSRIAPVLMFEVDEVRKFGKNLPGLVVAVAQILAVFGYMFHLSWQLASIVLTLFALTTAVMIVALPMQKRFERERSINRTKLHTKLELFNLGYKNLSINRKHGDHFIDYSIHTPNYRVAEENTKIELVKIVLEQLVTALVLIGLGVFFLCGQNWMELSQPVITQFVVVMIFILPSFIRIIVFFNELKKVENAIEQINELSEDLNDVAPIINSKNIDSKKRDPLLSLENIEYQYGENKTGFKLGPISATINTNEIVIINGGNGSGKTTLFNIIVGLFQPHKGKIKYKGEVLTFDNIQSYRNKLCCHFTDSPVFDDISYISEAKFKKSDYFIDQLELKGKTNLSFFRISDFNLSFGQKSRLNLMRLLIEDKSIFILDEWAANQDVHFKEKFYLEIIPKLKKEGKTVILISHDDKYYSIADKVISLRNGQIEEVLL